MNIAQRIVLILGAIALIVILFYTPRVCYYKGLVLDPEKRTEQPPHLARIVDWRSIGISSLVIAGATILVCFAFKTNRKKSEEDKINHNN